MLTASRAVGLEGIIAKRLDSPYQPGQRTGAWLKIKNQRRQELIIAGWVPGQGRRQGSIGALLVGYYNLSPEEAHRLGVTQHLTYAGKVGTGFSDRTLAELTKLLTELRRDENPFTTIPPVKDALFAEPLLIGEFEFTEWTDNNTLRHPSFKGLRTDKSPRAVIREQR
jgi:bifunctional non-homologous end joining protein LigD